MPQTAVAPIQPVQMIDAKVAQSHDTPQTRAVDDVQKVENSEEEVYSEDNFMESPEITANRKADVNAIVQPPPITAINDWEIPKSDQPDNTAVLQAMNPTILSD